MADVTQALCRDIDKEQFTKIGLRVDGLSKEVLEMVTSIVDSVCGDLDSYMVIIDNVLKEHDQPVTDEELEDFIMNLTSILYFVSDKQEHLGVEEDVAKAVHRDVFNRVREKAQGTVSDKDTAADLASQNEAVIYIVKSRAYKIIKAKAEMGLEMVNTLKKVITRRIAELGITKLEGA